MASKLETQSERRARIAASFAALGNDAFADDVERAPSAPSSPSSRGDTSASCRMPTPQLSSPAQARAERDESAPSAPSESTQGITSAPGARAPSAPSAPESAPMIPLPSEAQDAECDGCKLVHPAHELRHDERFDGMLCSLCLQSAERAQARLLAAQMPKLPRRGATQFRELERERYLKMSESAYRDWRRAPSAETTMALINAIGQRMQALSCSESEANDG